MRIPLAWRNLMRHKRRLALSLLGISFVVLLMFMEIGFLNGTLDSELATYRNFNADLVMFNSARRVDYDSRFARGRLYAARSCPAVDSVLPFYVRNMSWKIADTGELRGMRVFGFDSRDQALRAVSLEQQRPLWRTGTLLFDAKSRDVYGRTSPGTVVQMDGRSLEIVGHFELGVDLETDGNVVMDVETYFATYDSDSESPTSVDFGLIRLRPGSDVPAALAQIRASMEDDVTVLTREELAESVKRYWTENTGIAFLFNLGVFLGLVIGVIVCYQILFTDISVNLKPFATLKGMGYHNTYLIKVVLQQAALLGLMGFGFGLAGALVLYRYLQWNTGLVMNLTPERAGSILLLTLAMCLLAGLFAVRKVIQADPADCF